MADKDGNIFQMGLGRAPANFASLTPLGFLPRTAAIHPERVAVIHGDRRIVYREFDARARRLASALVRRGIGPGDTVSAVLPNVPAMLDAHFGVPMAGAVLNTINTRLDARTIAYILEHGEAKVLRTILEYAGAAGGARETRPEAADHRRGRPALSGARRAPRRSRVRSVPGDGRRRLRMDAADGRERAHHAQLHVGHHRQP